MQCILYALQYLYEMQFSFIGMICTFCIKFLIIDISIFFLYKCFFVPICMNSFFYTNGFFVYLLVIHIF